MTSPSEHRLPRAVVPRRYDLTIEPDLETCVFTGSVAITVDVAEPTAEIVLNARDLDVADAHVEQSGTAHDATITLDASEERLHLQLAREVDAGPATVHCTFRGKLHDDLVGFYRSRFTDDAGNEHTIAATQFEATHARRAFPCFDEPDHKAVYATTLIVDDAMLALSNSNEVSRAPAGNGKVRVEYAPTMPMSTYLVA